LKKNIRSSRAALTEAEGRAKDGGPVMTGQKVQITENLAPMAFSRFCESLARATSGFLKTVGVIALPG